MLYEIPDQIPNMIELGKILTFHARHECIANQFRERPDLRTIKSMLNAAKHLIEILDDYDAEISPDRVDYEAFKSFHASVGRMVSALEVGAKPVSDDASL